MATAAETRKKIAISLAAGISTNEIAESCDVSPSYVSQLKQDTSFQLMLAACKGDSAETLSKRNQLLDDMQDEVLIAIKSNLPKFLKTTGDAVRVFKMANEAKRSISPTIDDPSKVVLVSLPTFITNNTIEIKHETNENNEIIDIEGKALVTQSSDQLMKDINKLESKTIEADTEISFSDDVMDIDLDSL